MSREEIDAVLDPKLFTGRSEQQVERYLEQVVDPLLKKNAELLGEKSELKV